jgi:hypothetical protein
MKAKSIMLFLGVVAIFSTFCCNTRGMDREWVGAPRVKLAEYKIGVYAAPEITKLSDALAKDYISTMKGASNNVTSIQMPKFQDVHTMLGAVATNYLEACISPRKTHFWTEDMKFIGRLESMAPETEVFAYMGEYPVYFVYSSLTKDRWDGFAAYLKTPRAQAIVRDQGFTMLSYTSRP